MASASTAAEAGGKDNTSSNMSTKKSPPAWAAGVPTKLIKKINLVEEGPDRLPVYTLTFEIPNAQDEDIAAAALSGPAIHHSQVRIDMGDVVKMVIPGYKPKSYSVSALRETEFDVTLKVYPNGRASGFLDRLSIGDSIQSFGKHRNGRRNPGAFVGIIAYGVGITEAWPLARAELQDKPEAKHVILLWANRTRADTFWSNEMEQLQAQFNHHGENHTDNDKLFEIRHIYSREPSSETEALHGRIQPDTLRQVFGEAAAAAVAAGSDQQNGAVRFISVGTKEMMRHTDDMLTEIGYPMPAHHLLPKNKE